MEKEQDLKPADELRGNLNEQKLNPVSEKETTPLPERKVTDVVTFKKNDSILVVETVPSFRNFQNYLNKPRKKTRFYNDRTVVEEVEIDYELFENPNFELVFGQTEKIILNGEKVEKERENLVKFLENEPTIFYEIINKILENAGDMGLIKRDKNE